ncbi:DUF5682 family protein [Streptomyces sp. NPDC002138]|uniref:DUF5682 family protein n=1 Tax=Streptomyces sp. NPDC002138 TaxID=3154410 RepID=UPI0033293A86
MTSPEPRSVVAALAASREPYLLGVRHHSPALAAVTPALLAASGADVVCVELPADFQPWLPHLGDPETLAPIALAGTTPEGHLAFYPFADFSPELSAIRWARARNIDVICCDLPLTGAPPAASHPAPSAGAHSASPAFEAPPEGVPAVPAVDPASSVRGGSGDAHPAAAGAHSASPAFEAPPEGVPAVPAVAPASSVRGGLGDAHPVAAGAHSASPAFEAPPEGPPAVDPGGPPPPPARPRYAAALSAKGTGRDGEDLWDRAVEVLAPGCPPEAIRRAALGVGWALREDTGAIDPRDLAREAHMREVITALTAAGRRVAAVIGAFHAPALLPHPAPSTATSPPPPANGTAPAPSPAAGRGPDSGADPVGPATSSSPGTRLGIGRGTDAGTDAGTAPVGPGTATGPGAGPGTHPRPGDGTGTRTPGPGPRAGAGAGGVVTSLVPYSFDLLDSRSGYPAGIRDPLWQQAVLTAAGDPARVRDAASVAVTAVCRELRRAGHTAGTGEAAETLRVACDLARLRGLPAPGRGELLEAVTTVLAQGEPLGRGRALARALEAVLIGTARGRTAPHTPRSGLGPSVEAELAALRLPSPEDPAPREIRLDPLRSALDARREVLLQRLLVCGAAYGEQLTVAATGDGAALGTKWRLSWTPSVPARLDLAGVRGVTAEQAAAGTLRDTARRAAAEGGPTCAQVLTGLAAAARCDLPALLTARLEEAAEVLPAAATLPELLESLELLEALRRGHLPGGRVDTTALGADLLDASVRALPGLAGSEDPADAAALVALADRAAAHRLGLRLDASLATLTGTGPATGTRTATASPLMQGAAFAVRVLLDLDPAADLGDRAAGWIDSATTADGRRALTRRLAGLFTAAGPLLDSSPAALTPLLDRIDRLADQEFLDRLPALRGGFDALAPAARDRLLDTVTERLGDRIDLSLDAPPALLARWAAADAAGLAALAALPLPVPLPVPRTAGTPATVPTPVPAPAGDPRPEPAAPHRLTPPDRWRLLLGRHHDRLSAGARRYAHALDELYGAGRGEGASDLDGGGSGGGREASFPTAREWAEELEALFGTDVREEVLAAAAGAGRTDVLTQLAPASVRPSVELLTSVLSLAGGLPEQQLARLRPLVKRLVEEVRKELATRLRPALSGLSTPRPTRRPGGMLDLPRTLRANLAHARRLDDGRVVVVPERPVFSTRVNREADWRLILVVDVSGSMEASVVWSALTAAVLAGVPMLSTHFLAFSTEVVDLTGQVEDPLSLLLEVRVGGGTHIAAGLAHARSLITVPSRTLVVVVSDFEEGGPLGGLLGEVRALAASGARLMGCAALDDSGTPRYSVPVARQLVAAGMPVAALSPLALARWVGDRLRGDRP